MFRYLASLLYFLDRLDRLLALESRAARVERRRSVETEGGWKDGSRGQVRAFGRTRQGLPSLQHLLYVSHHDPLDVLQLRVDAAQIPPSSTVNVRLLGFLDVGVW